MPFRLVIDMSQAILVEIYREYGMKFEEAKTEIYKTLHGPEASETPKGKQHAAQNEAASMAMLQSMMSGSDFKGPKG